MVINSTVSTMSRYRFIAVFVLASVLVGVISAAIWMVGTEMASAARLTAQVQIDRQVLAMSNPCEPCPPPQIHQKGPK